MYVYTGIVSYPLTWRFTSSPSRQNDRHFADYIFRCIFVNENVCILIEMSLKFVPYGPINNIPSLVQIMAWRRPGDKPLSVPMMVNLLTHICVIRPQSVNVTHIWYVYTGTVSYPLTWFNWAHCAPSMFRRVVNLLIIVWGNGLSHHQRDAKLSYSTEILLNMFVFTQETALSVIFFANVVNILVPGSVNYHTRVVTT